MVGNRDMDFFKGLINGLAISILLWIGIISFILEIRK